MKHKYSLILLIILFALIIGQVVYIYNDETNVITETGILKAGMLQDAEDYILTPGNVVTQKFQFDDLMCNKVLIYFEKLDSKVEGTINIAVKDADANIISQWSPLLEDMEPSLFYVVFFYEEDIFQENIEYYVEISIENNEQNDCALKVVDRTKDNEWLNSLENNNETIDGKVAYIELDRDYLNKEKLINEIKISIIVDISILILLFIVFWIEKSGKKVYEQLIKSERFSKIRKCFEKQHSAYGIMFAILILGMIGGFYHSLQDLFFILVLFSSAYIYGLWFLRIFKIENRYACLGIGLCLIGVVVCHIISFGWGCKTIYFMVLVIPCLIGHQELFNVVKKAKEGIKVQPVYAIVLLIILAFYIVLGSRPIEASDALLKHLPISVYAAELGCWYDNIFENIVAFSESTLLHYSFTTMMVEFECYKALTLFNVFLFFIIFAIIYKVAKTIYSKTNKWLLIGVYFFIPYVIQVATTFTVDVFPMLIVFTCIILIHDFNYREIIKKIPILSFLFGCAIYTKLTILSSVLMVCFVIGGLLVSYVYHQRKEFKVRKIIFEILKIMPISLFLFIVPFFYSFMRNWYLLGNPFSITAYNNIFNSPYFSSQVFDRPFTDNAMGANLKCFWDIAFHTNSMVEAENGAMGYVWLLVLLIPIGCILTKNKKLLTWLITSLLGIQFAGMIVGNLRYVIAILIVIEVLIVISISAILSRMKGNNLRKIFYFVIIFLIVSPNIMFMHNSMFSKEDFQPDQSITKCDNTEILCFVPEYSNVFAVNDENKGAYKGFYFYFSWHNDYVYDKLITDKIDLDDFWREFDYVILKKGLSIRNEYDAFSLSLCEQAIEDNVLVEYKQSEKYILYKVVDNEQKTPLISGEDVSLVSGEDILVVAYDAECYQVVVDMGIGEKNESVSDTTIQEFYIEVVCRDIDDNVIMYSLNAEKLYSWRDCIDTGWVEVPQETYTITIKIKNKDDQNIQIQSYQIYAQNNVSVFDDWLEDYYERDALIQ